MLNKIILIGNLGKKPELKYTGSGLEVCEFTMATTNNFSKEKKTTWHNIVVFGSLANNCEKYLDKGSSVYIEGEQCHESYEKKDGSKGYYSSVRASVVQFLDSKKGDRQDEQQSSFNPPF
jgi:single-strand DNA-binding protein